MKKFKILIIIVIAIVGALLIYNHFDNKKITENKTDKFLNEYTLVSKNHVFEYKNIDEIINLFESGTAIIFFCDPGSQWCQHYAWLLNEVALEAKIDKIYYMDIKEDRNLNSSKYQKIVEELQIYLNKDDTGKERLNMPDVVFIKDGNVIANDCETSIISSDISPKEYWTNDNIYTIKEKLKENMNLLNIDVIE